VSWLTEGFALNNREIATLVWSAIAIAAFGLKQEGRSAMWAVVRALCQPILLSALAVATLWIGGCVILMEREGLWEVANLKTTVVWAVTFAFVTMFDIERIGKPGFADKVVRDTINATAVVVFIAEFATFGLLAELAFVPFLVFLTLLRAISETKLEFAPVRKLLNGLAILVGAVIFAWSVFMIATEFTAFAQRSTALEFSVPIVLSLLFLPFIFVFGRWVAYERVFSAFIYAVPDPALRRYTRWRGLMAFGPDVEGLDRWRNLLVRERPGTRIEVDEAVVAIKVAQGREKNPPAVGVDEGWSPYAAKVFLEAQGLPTNAWQDLGDGEWSCSATLLDIDGGLMPNRLGYYLVGDALTARRLRLKLYINSPEAAPAAEARFVEVAAILLEKAGLERFIGLLDDLGPGDSRADDGTNTHVVTLTRENWVRGVKGGYERMLTVRSRSFEAADN
jgi:hypothetical protein